MQIELVQVFVQVIRAGSFTRAAEVLRLPKSTVSKAVSRLEAESGTKLLVRTTRSQTLTAAGKAFYDSCLGPIQAIEDAQKSLSGSDSLMVGTLKITAPEDLGNMVLAPAAGFLTKKHPGLNFEFNYTDQVLDLVADGIDLAVRVGTLEESRLKSKKVGEVRLIAVASPRYLKQKSRIGKPEDLREHSCLAMTGDGSTWELCPTSGKTVSIKIRPRIWSNQMSSLLNAALSGAGVAMVPSFLGEPYLAAGKLVRVLPQWNAPGLSVSILSPLPFSASARLRMVVDYFTAELGRVLGRS